MISDFQLRSITDIDNIIKTSTITFDISLLE